MVSREIIIDAETTGLYHAEGDRIIELCAIVVEHTQLGRMWHKYFDPGVDIKPDATRVHGITNDMLDGAPKFEDVADDFLAFVEGAYLIAHNAPFDEGFIRAELQRCGKEPTWLRFIDTIPIAKKKVPGKKYSLDALCKHYGISLAARRLHGATLDCKLLAEVYMRLAGRLEQTVIEKVNYERIHYPGGEVGYLVPNNMPHPGPRPVALASLVTPEEAAAWDAMVSRFTEMRAIKDAEMKELEEALDEALAEKRPYERPPQPPMPVRDESQFGSRPRRLRDRR
jgi:DNA polymerase III subunit epsilon